MTRRLLLAGNWKMNKNNGEAIALAKDLVARIGQENEKDILICPPFTALPSVSNVLQGTTINLGAQNMHFEKSGAFTGEISADLLISSGCTYVILGHSERRQYFVETDALVNKKALAALAAGLIPVICVGETLSQREANLALSVIETQVTGSLANFTTEQMQKSVIAYEPVWAIGTGKTATPAQAQEVHAHIRQIITKLFGKQLAECVRILYGGSVTPDNSKELMGQADIDGALVGGASLKADAFEKIVKNC